MADLHIELRGLTKTFGSLTACDKIDLKITRGTIHGIIGENGAGKSTLMKMLFGMIEPDAGEILLGGTPTRMTSAREAVRLGIGMVHQHFMLSEVDTVLDNIILGAHGTRWPLGLGLVPRRSARRKLMDICQRYQLPVDLDARILNLPVGLQQRVEILKVLYRDCDVLILDEPTAVLSPLEINEFFAQLRRLRDEGKTILLISHKLKEIMSVTDEVSVMRKGQIVGQRQTQATSAEELAQLMIGRRLQSLEISPASTNERTILKINNLTWLGHLEQVSLSVQSGEIVGIAGVEGNGQSQLLEILLHGQDHPEVTGEIENRSSNVGILPEDRQREALLMDSPLSENLLLGHHKSFQNYGVIRRQALLNTTHQIIEEYDVRPRQVRQLARNLSGGNQQKFVVGRELLSQPDLIFAAHPTRGVDIGAIYFIHQQLLEARSRGAGVLLVSSELDELMQLSDRILVFYRGQIVAEFKRGDYDEQKLGMAMGGGQRQ